MRLQALMIPLGLWHPARRVRVGTLRWLMRWFSLRLFTGVSTTTSTLELRSGTELQRDAKDEGMHPETHGWKTTFLCGNWPFSASRAIFIRVSTVFRGHLARMRSSRHIRSWRMMRSTVTEGRSWNSCCDGHFDWRWLLGAISGICGRSFSHAK